MSEDFELAVVGAGPAGMEAAIAASEAGVNTALIDGFPEAGGQYYKKPPAAFSVSRKTDVEIQGDELSQRLESTPVAGFFNALTWGLFKAEGEEGWLVALAGPDAPKWIRARTLVLATGAYDTPVAFPGWTLPGVITTGAALILAKSQRVAPGRRALVTGSGPLLLSAAAHLVEAGVEVASVCESARFLPKGILHAPALLGHMHRVREAAQYLGILSHHKVPFRTGWSILEALGQEHVENALIGEVDRMGFPIAGSERNVDVDTVVCGYGLTPNTGLARLIGCEMRYEPQNGGWVPIRDERTLQSSLPGVYVAGDGAGIRGAENARLEGRLAGVMAALHTGCLSKQEAGRIRAQAEPDLARQRRFARVLSDLFPPKAGWFSLAKDETPVCRCEEVCFGEIKAAIADGAQTLTEVKMVIRAGMGNCQGRMCEGPVSGAIARAMATGNARAESIGYYSIRPPLFPLPMEFLEATGQDK